MLSNREISDIKFELIKKMQEIRPVGVFETYSEVGRSIVNLTFWNGDKVRITVEAIE